MPVEIKELVIRTVVGPGPAQPQESGGLDSSAPQGSGGGASQEELVQECVRQVLRILESKKDR